MGAQIPNRGGPESQMDTAVHPILSALNQPQQAAPQWGGDTSTPIANPNNNFMLQALSGANSTGYNPNQQTNSGVPITNTPSINSQDNPSIGGLNSQLSSVIPQAPAMPSATISSR